MTVMQIIFIAAAAATLISALLVVTSRNLVHSALWLVVSLFGVAILYALLSAGFLAIVQVVVYIGAIAILFIFAAMLTRRMMQDTGPQSNANWWLAALLAAALFGGLIWLLNGWAGFTSSQPVLSMDANQLLRKLGADLVSPDAYVLPFELASVLLIAAMIGAIVVAWERK
jgi:NADH-quinone oxidoreductase subunit J